MVIVETLSHINMPAKNLQRSVEFYTQFLDFEILEEGKDYTIVSFDNINLKLDTKLEPYSKVPILSFILDVDDFTEALQEAEDIGVEIAKGPFEIEGGESVYIADPSGNLVELYYRED
ncbi:MAG: VOC family protein [Turneriella sp.]|nr:VOC family protein [Leptospiraceae bacterium]MCX7632888.1 VOC family protein [Turneriella sp.]